MESVLHLGLDLLRRRKQTRLKVLLDQSIHFVEDFRHFFSKRRGIEREISGSGAFHIDIVKLRIIDELGYVPLCFLKTPSGRIRA